RGDRLDRAARIDGAIVAGCGHVGLRRARADDRGARAGWPASSVDGGMSVVSSPSTRLLGCECCGLVSTAPREAVVEHATLRCPRCLHPLHTRNPAGLQRTWGWLL